tara:strand:- start:892 stop:1449 length:558 start_codon:yes stop_codon:yes gene_type:complete
MKQFQQKGFEVRKRFIPIQFSTYLRNYFFTLSYNEQLKGDSQAPNSHCVYGDLAFDMVMAMSTNIIGECIDKTLVPQYTYARIYNNGSVLERHTDRPECEYSVTLSLGGSYEKSWPIWIKDYDGNDHCVDLDEGDILIYKGTKLEHWREKFEGDAQCQLFMHYVDAKGEFKDRVLDGRPNLGYKK